MSEPVTKFPTSAEDISIEAFEHWLNQFTPNQIVGRSCEARACPVACFLLIQGYDTPTVERTTMYFGDKTSPGGARPTISNPDWMLRFIEKIDNRAQFDGQGIQARTARRILSEVIEEVGHGAQ